MRKLLAIILTVCFALTVLCGCSVAESLIDNYGGSHEPAEEPAAEPVEAPAEEPVEAPAEEPVEEPAALTCSWMGYTIELTSVKPTDAKMVFGPTTAFTPEGQLVEVKFTCVDCEIPTDIIDGNLDACIWLEDVNGTLGTLDASIVSHSFNGVAFDPETGEFSILDTHTEFGVVLDVPDGIALEDFIVCICSCDGESDTVKMPVALIPPEEPAE